MNLALDAKASNLGVDLNKDMSFNSKIKVFSPN